MNTSKLKLDLVGKPIALKSFEFVFKLHIFTYQNMKFDLKLNQLKMDEFVLFKNTVK